MAIRGKLAVVILAIAATACGLLVVRQQRLEAVADMAGAIERAAALDRKTWTVRASIAREIETIAAETGEAPAEGPVEEWGDGG